MDLDLESGQEDLAPNSKRGSLISVRSAHGSPKKSSLKRNRSVHFKEDGHDISSISIGESEGRSLSRRGSFASVGSKGGGESGMGSELRSLFNEALKTTESGSHNGSMSSVLSPTKQQETRKRNEVEKKKSTEKQIFIAQAFARATAAGQRQKQPSEMDDNVTVRPVEEFTPLPTIGTAAIPDLRALEKPKTSTMPSTRFMDESDHLSISSAASLQRKAKMLKKRFSRESAVSETTSTTTPRISLRSLGVLSVLSAGLGKQADKTPHEERESDPHQEMEKESIASVHHRDQVVRNAIGKMKAQLAKHATDGRLAADKAAQDIDKEFYPDTEQDPKDDTVLGENADSRPENYRVVGRRTPVLPKTRKLKSFMGIPITYPFSRREKFEEGVDYESEESDSFDPVENVEKFMELQTVREKLHSNMMRQTFIFTVPLVVVYLLFYLSMIFTAITIATRQDEYFSSTQTVSMNLASNEGARATTGPVVLVILGGVGYDSFMGNSAFQTFLSTYSADLKSYEATSTIPTNGPPNWMTILSGAPPELTGYMSDEVSFESRFDTLVHRANETSLAVAVTGSPLLTDMVKSGLIRTAHADGIISYAEAASDRQDATYQNMHDFSESFDSLVVANAISAISATTYDLTLVHFLDADAKGRRYGISGESYDTALTNLASHCTSIITQVQASALAATTSVVFVGDHGHVSAGGSGGVSSAEMKVPLVIYKSGSGFASSTYSGTRFDSSLGSSVSLLHVAPTVALLMGIPTPRQAQGVWIDDAVHLVGYSASELTLQYKDLLSQKQNFVSSFLSQSGTTSSSSVLTSASGTSTDSYTNDVIDLVEIFNSKRQEAFALAILRNVLSNLVFGIIFMSLLLCFLQFNTFADLRRLFMLRVKYAHSERLAIMYAFVSVGVYIIGGILLLVIFESIRGYDWDWAAVSGLRNQLFTYIAVLLIGFFLNYLVSVIGKLISIKWLPGTTPMQDIFWPKFILNRVSSAGSSLLGGDPSILLRSQTITYLINVYTIFFVCMIMVLILTFAGVFTFFIPKVLDIKLMDTHTWKMRFEIMTTMFIMTPLTLRVMVLLFLRQQDVVWGYAYDGIFLARLKQEQVEGQVREVIFQKLGFKVLLGKFKKLYKYVWASDKKKIHPENIAEDETRLSKLRHDEQLILSDLRRASLQQVLRIPDTTRFKFDQDEAL